MRTLSYIIQVVIERDSANRSRTTYLLDGYESYTVEIGEEME